MQGKTFVIMALLACAATLSATNPAFFWWNDLDDYDSTTQFPVDVPKEGEFKAVVLVMEFPDFDSNYVDDDTIYPTFYDSLITSLSGLV